MIMRVARCTFHQSTDDGLSRSSTNEESTAKPELSWATTIRPEFGNLQQSQPEQRVDC